MYTYLADCSGKSGRGGAFRSLQRGFAHWSSGRLAKLEVNNLHPHFSHIRCQMTPSMRKGLYRVYILLGYDGDLATIVRHAAGYVILLTNWYRTLPSIYLVFSENQHLVLMYRHCFMPLRHLHLLGPTKPKATHLMKKQQYQSPHTYVSGMNHVNARRATRL